jgi:hypothetical protein
MNDPTLPSSVQPTPQPVVAPSGGCCWEPSPANPSGHPSHPSKPGVQSEPWLTALSAVTLIPVRDLASKYAQMGLRSLELTLLGESGVESMFSYNNRIRSQYCPHC